MTIELLASLVTLGVCLTGLVGVGLTTGWLGEAWYAIVAFASRMLPPYGREIEESVTYARPRVTGADQAQALRDASKRSRNRRRYADWDDEYFKLTPRPGQFPPGCTCRRDHVHGFNGHIIRTHRHPSPDCTAHEEHP